MAGFKSTYLCNKVLDFLYGGVAFTPPSAYYFALMTAAPTAGGGGTEASGGGYARVSVTKNQTSFPASSSGTLVTGVAIDWGTFSATLGAIVGIAWYDASSSGNLIGYGPLSVTVTINSGNAFKVASGNGTITEA